MVIARGPDPAFAEGGAGGEEVERDRAEDGVVVRSAAADGKAMPREVCSPTRRYHNHLDAAIVTTGWSQAEENTLSIAHAAVGNKWSVIAQRLPGR